MDAKVTNFRNLMAESIVGERDRLVTPVFQRQYVWGKEQWTDLWTDIERLVESSRNPESDEKDDHHIMGMVVIQKQDGQNKARKQLIDGQQRITTLVLLLAAMRRVLLSEPDSARVVTEIESYLFRRPLATEKEASDKVKLCLGLKDRETFFQILLHDGKNKLKLKRSNITNCAEFWKQKLELLSEPELHEVYDTVVKRLDFVCMILDNGEAESFVFATVNGSGVQLTVSELIKNSLLQDEKEETAAVDIHEQYWQPFEDMVPTSNGQKRFFETMITLLRGSSHAKNVYREVKGLRDELKAQFYPLFMRLSRLYSKDEDTVRAIPAKLALRWHLLANDNKVNLMLICSVLGAFLERRLSEQQALRAMDLSLYLVTKSRMLDEDNHLATDIGKQINKWHKESGEAYLYLFEKFVRSWKTDVLSDVFKSPTIEEMGVKAQAELCMAFYVLGNESKALSEKAALNVLVEPANTKKKNSSLGDYNVKWGESPVFTYSLSHHRRDDLFALGEAYFEDLLRIEHVIPDELAEAENEAAREKERLAAEQDDAETVEAGSVVTISFSVGGVPKNRTFKVVSGQVSASSESISLQSVAGRMLHGKKAGDSFDVPLGDGGETVKVVIGSVR